MADDSQDTTHFGFQTVAKAHGGPRISFRGGEVRCDE